MAVSVRVPIEETSQAAEARRVAHRMANEAGFDEVRAGQVAIVVAEACSNILKHAGRGEILLQISRNGGEGAPPQFEMLALDKGEGMPNLEQCLQDGYTTGSSPGQGLGAIRRLSDESDFYSAPGDGCVVLARWTAGRQFGGSGQPLHVGAVSVSKYGEDFCGDSWGIQQSGNVSTLMVADGLGHGFEASLASLEAVRILRSHPDESPGSLIDLAHRALRSSRGAAVSVAHLDLAHDKITFSGLGNVVGQIYAGQVFGGKVRSQHLVSVNGTAGHHSARIREFTYAWPAGGILVMHSDGLATSASLDPRPVLAKHDPALIAGVLYRDFSRGHDDATVVIAKVA